MNECLIPNNKFIFLYLLWIKITSVIKGTQ